MAWIRTSGTLSRIDPSHELFAKNPDGAGQALTPGLHWYWTSHARLQFHYRHGRVTDNAVSTGSPVSGSYDIIGVRVMVDFRDPDRSTSRSARAKLPRSSPLEFQRPPRELGVEPGQHEETQMVQPRIRLDAENGEDAFITPAYGGRSAIEPVPKYRIPKKSMEPGVAYDLIRDELILDGNSRLNLATFVTTWMEDEARQLMTDTFDKNMIDKDEYPQTAEIELRCVNILSRLWNAPDHLQAVGCSTIGSSEAAMLGGMALKWKWRARRRARNEPADRPNMVMGINVQVCWEKFCRYWEVEPRFVPMDGNRFCLNAEEAVKLVDENTIGVVVIMGSTFDGRYENVKEVNDALEKLNAEHGWEVPIHVDGASGGFVAPFLQPRLEWDFRVPLVKSINTSGHKFGLVYPGVGWVIWRDQAELPEELIFHCNYLGGDLPNFALNFSRPGNQVVAQYYNFLRLGHEGYRRVHQASQDVARHLSGEIARMGPFQLISDGSDIPVFAFSVQDSAKFSVFDMSDKLRERGWLLPAYTFPKNREDLAVLRAVCKEGFTRDMADNLLHDMRAAVKFFESRTHHEKKIAGAAFHH